MVQNSIESKIRCLQKAAKILRKNILTFKKESKTIFSGSIDHDKKSIPPVLVTFLEQLTPEESGLTQCRNVGIENDVCTYAKIFSYCITSDTQVNHNLKLEETCFYSTDATLQQIGVSNIYILEVKRNKHTINLLHDYMLSVPDEQILRLEIGIANTILEQT